MMELTNEEESILRELEKEGYWYLNVNQGLAVDKIFNSREEINPETLEKIFEKPLTFGDANQIKYKDFYKYYTLILKRDF